MADEVQKSELDEIKSFIIEAVQRVDPSLDTSTGSPMDTYLITPLMNRLGTDPYSTPMLDFIRSRLTTEFPDISVNEGEPIEDTVIKPFYTMTVPYRRMINQIRRNQSLADPASLRDEEADNLGANFFTPRKQGGYSTVTARLYYSAPQADRISPTNAIFTSSGLRFLPVETQAISVDSMTFNTEGGLYYFDVLARSEKVGASYQIAAGALNGIEGKTNVVKVTNKVASSPASDQEDTATYVARIGDSLTERSLVAVRGINARLSDVFPTIKTSQVIGFGDPEMNRDILKGSGAPYSYAYVTGYVSTGSQDLLHITTINDGDVNHLDVPNVGVRVGDYVIYHDPTAHAIYQAAITELVDDYTVRVDPNLPVQTSNERYAIARSSGVLTISDIPGGIVDTDTLAGPVEVLDGEVHIGGALDVYVRGENPQPQNIALSNVRDENPLHFGLDLESFGEDENEFVNMTPKITGVVRVPGTDRYGDPVTDHLLVLSRSGSYVPWEPEARDVDRYVQLLDGSTGPIIRGTFKIVEIVGREYDGTDFVTRIRINLLDEDSGGTVTLTPTVGYEYSAKVREKVTVKDRVRDRDNSRLSGAGIDFEALGVKVGDSLVLESGDDAGVYSIRRMLSSIDSNDTLIVSSVGEGLTRTVRPSGLGDHSGLRYRINNELDVDLVFPRVTKIPIGEIFTGDDLQTVASSPNVSVSGTTNFLLAGVVEGDTLEILEGDNAGIYTIKSVTGTAAVLTAPVQTAGTGLSFAVYTSFTGVVRPVVRVRDVELLDSSGQPTSFTIPYGDVVDIRVHGDFSNRAEGSAVESLEGSVTNYPDNRLYDLENNFAAKGVLPGYRVTILNTSNAGDYTVKDLSADTDPAPWWIELESESAGGRDLRVNTVSIHYRVGIASAGIARMYFVKPTSVEVATGLVGARLQYSTGETIRMFRFSEVEGMVIQPSPGSTEGNPRGLRVVRSFTSGGDDFSILELSESSSNVFSLELQEGDLIEAYEQIPFRNSSGDTFETLGVLEQPAGLVTITGSNKVSVPANSLIDFVEMNDPVYSNPLVGQDLYIESGPDAGVYKIEEVINSKTLRVDHVMTSATSAIVGKDQLVPRDGQLLYKDGDPNLGKVWLKDPTDNGAFGTQVGYYVTILESKVPSIAGTHEITAIAPPSDPNYPYLEFDLDLPAEVTVNGTFTWVRTPGQDNVMQPFRIYNAIPLQTAVTEVATVEPEVLAGVRDCVITNSTTMVDTGGVAGISEGDRIEVLAGDAMGVYTVATVTLPNTLTIYAYHPFPAVGSFKYRARGGIYGSRTMVTVGSWEGGRALIVPGERVPYRIRRPGLLRASSTEVQQQFDGSLYYVDAQIESDGAGDDLSLQESALLTVSHGVQVDGYQQVVANNTLTFSPYERLSLVFSRRFLPAGNSDNPENMLEISGRNLKVNYDNSTIASVVNDYLRSETERPVNANPIARHFMPSYIYATFRYRGGGEQADVATSVANFINNQPTTGALEVSDIEAIISRSGAEYVQHPLLLTSVTHDIDRKLVVDRSEDQIGGLEVPYNGTARTATFFAISGDGLNVEKIS